ncbi:MAG: shikimate dehydrogenase [Trichloromonadaceae bacterium]
MNINGKTRILGIFGDPVSHSLSPLMQNHALEAAGIDAVFVPFHVRPEQLGQAVAGIRALDLLGVNVTVPHKEAVCAYLDDIDPVARQIGAVNTIVNRNGRLFGHNTDGLGFLRSLQQDLGLHPQGLRILLLGAGGACRAALVALCQAGATHITIANRTPERAEGLATEFGQVFGGITIAASSLEPDALKRALAEVDLVVNTSAAGLKGEAFPGFPWATVPARSAFYDMVYGPGLTPCLTEAQRRSHPVAGGLGMLAGQGEEAFYLWTGKRPPFGAMRARLLAATDPQ